MNLMEAITKEVRVLLLEHELEPVDVATQLGITRQVMHNRLTGATNWDVATLVRLGPLVGRRGSDILAAAEQRVAAVQLERVS